MPFRDENVLSLDHEKLYSPGQTLSLTPHRAPKPWGWEYYPMPPDLKDVDTAQSEEDMKLTRLDMVFQEKNQPHRLDRQIQKDESRKMKVEILEAIRSDNSGRYTPGTQKLKCKVLQVPSGSPSNNDPQYPAVDNVIFIKVFDPMFFPRNVSFIDSQWKVTARADMALSNEAGAYEYLHGRDLTGKSNLAPEWLGCWTAEVQTTYPEYEGRTRYVGVIALEYIDGICLQKLLWTNEDGEHFYIGDHLNVDDDVKKLKELDQETRLGVIKDLLDGAVKQYQVNVNHSCIWPENVILSFRRGSEELERPRVSLVGYKDSSVGALRQPPRTFWSRYQKPIHPWYRFSYTRLRLFFLCRWFPSDWQPDENPEESRPLSVRIVDAFGPLEYSNDCSGWFEPRILREKRQAELATSRELQEKSTATKPAETGETETVVSHEDPQKASEHVIETEPMASQAEERSSSSPASYQTPAGEDKATVSKPTDAGETETTESGEDAQKPDDSGIEETL
ncbi:hypothetical protein LZ30DRAFT_599318 [Colletotrichum cereale]|nr:hypothetical protein LZ30DRAFT_599318 [Colletotrichum cereale]